jgi:putative transposase
MLHISNDLLKYFKNFCSSPSVIMLFIYMKSRCSLSYRELEEMMIMRGARIDHSPLQRGVGRFTRLIDKRVRTRKKPVDGVVGAWMTRRAAQSSKTYIKLNGKWIYLYRAVKKEGNTIDFLLRAKRDAIAAKAFFRKTFKHQSRPDKVTVDKSGSNKAALDACNQGIEEGKTIEIRQVKYLNNIIEQAHRFVKKRTRPMLGFKNFHSASMTITGIENIRMIQKRQVEGCDAANSTFHNFCALMA